MFKKLILVLSFLLVCTAFCYANGENEEILYPDENRERIIQNVEKVYEPAYKTRDLYSSESLTLDDAYNDIKNAMLGHKSSVDISKYGFKYDEEKNDFDDSLWEVYQKAAYKNPSSFAVYNMIENITYNKADNTILDISIVYLFDSEDMDEYDKIYSEKIKAFVDYGKNFKTDFDKVLAIHDKIIDDYDYWQLYDNEGNEIFDSSDYPQITSSPMAFFLYGKATCVGYSQLFGAVMEKLGIETEYCTNENHIWNLVRVDGKWYHIDTTHDDPIYTTSTDEGGTKRVYYKGARHKYFLVSEETMLADSGRFISNPWEYTKYYSAEDKTYEENTVFSLFGDVFTMFVKNSSGNYDFSVSAGDKNSYTFTSGIKLSDVLHTNIYKTQSGNYAVQFYDLNGDLSQYDIFVGYYDKNGVMLGKQNADITNLYTGDSKINYYKTSGTVSTDARKIKFDKKYEKTGNKAKLYIWKTDDLLPCSVSAEYEF